MLYNRAVSTVTKVAFLINPEAQVTYAGSVGHQAENA